MPKKEVKAIPMMSIPLTEALKAQVELKPVKFPAELGEEHPFNFKECEQVFCGVGFVQAVAEKYIDFIINQDFHTRSDDVKAQTLINQFIEESNFEQLIREWIKEALVKGNGFLELSFDKNTVQMKIINANDVYIMRDKQGNIQGYNQYVGGFDKFDMRKVIPFSPNEVAHLAITKIGDCPYGYGIVRAGLQVLNNMARSERDMHVLIGRKANAPIVATIGSPEEPATQNDIDSLTARFVYLNNLHEWVFSHHVKMEALDFGNLAEKFATVLEHDKEMLYNIFQIPAVIMGMANVPEGLAKVQLDTFQRRIQSIQANIEQVIEQQIFKPLLKENGLSVDVEIEWGLPSEQEVNDRITTLSKILLSPILSSELRSLIEKEIAKVLQFKEQDIDLLPTPEEAAQKEADKEAQMQQPEIPGSKPMASENIYIKNSWNFQESDDMTIKEFVNLQEVQGFNYRQYLSRILKIVKTDEFTSLKALNEQQQADGLLSEDQIYELRNILHEGFKKNLTIAQIESKIAEMNLPDRLNEGKLVLSSESRPSVIARTETVRLANEGLIEVYKENDIEHVRWLSSISDRTCQQCLDLNGKLFPINEAPMPAVDTHANCRCSLLSVRE